MKECNYFVFVVSDSEDIDGNIISAKEILEYRISKLMWPLYRRTQNKSKLKVNDRCLFYLGGRKSNSQTIVGMSAVKSITPWLGHMRTIDHESILSEYPSTVLHLQAFEYFNRPVEVKSILDDLSFIPQNRVKWGTAFQGGVRKIKRHDFDIILKAGCR
ncbi:EVE domain-containing protein [Microbulbifer sp. CnH-101-G]|uniref:EVE domain-containing protein n=1 Tax=Microbulbifer sp. CnH-101-G TaxID=3243393 RepID=UPI004039EB2D